VTERVIRIDLDREIERERVSSMSTETTKWRGLNNTFVDGSNFSFIFFRFIKLIFCLEHFEYRLLSKYFSVSSLSNFLTQINEIFLWSHNYFFANILKLHLYFTFIKPYDHDWNIAVFTSLIDFLQLNEVVYVFLWSNEF